ncbi:MAG: preprotein translocase subunit SecA, partial [Gammaproteobacteria bacterium]|nr:preprotein translocase subunit SecA [Gammaproteobacteria bacterium]
AIEHPWVNKAIENAQRKVEGHNFDIRKQLLEYDDVANEQRKVIYQQRNTLISMEDVSENLSVMIEEVTEEIMASHIPHQSQESQWDVKGLEEALKVEYGLPMPVAERLAEDDDLHEEPLRQKMEAEHRAAYQRTEDQAGAGAMRHLEKSAGLQVLEERWKERLANMD